MPPPKLKKAEVENQKMFKSATTVIWVERDTTGPAYNNSHKVRAESESGCVWKGPLTGPPSGEKWKAVVTFQAGSCGPVVAATATQEKPPPTSGGGAVEDIAITVTNPGNEESNEVVAVQCEIVP